MGKKSSKVCCIYHKPREQGEDESGSDSSSSESDSDDSDSDEGRREARRSIGRARRTSGRKRSSGEGCEHDHAGGQEHDHGEEGKNGHDDIGEEMSEGDGIVSGDLQRPSRRRSPNAYERMPRPRNGAGVRARAKGRKVEKRGKGGTVTVTEET